MRKVSELEGMTVIDVKDGTKLGEVAEMVVSPEDLRLLGFVLKTGGLFDQKEKIVEIGDVRAIGDDAITVDGADVAHTSEESSEDFRRVRESDRRLSGKKVVTDTGSVIGTVSDAVIDPATKRISALLIGGGILQSPESIHVDRISSVGPDVIVAREGVPTS